MLSFDTAFLRFITSKIAVTGCTMSQYVLLVTVQRTQGEIVIRVHTTKQEGQRKIRTNYPAFVLAPGNM